MEQYDKTLASGTESLPNLSRLPTGDRDQDTAILNAVLDMVYDYLDSDAELRRQLAFTVSARHSDTATRSRSLEHYLGPDDETIEELAIHHQRWLHDPALFWQPPSVPDFSRLTPEAQIIGCFVFRNRSDT